MRYINPRFTYLLTYNLPRAITQRRSDQQSTVWPTDHKSDAQHRCVTAWPTIHGGPQKWNHKLMAIMICEILTDYQKLYTGIVAGKFAVKWLLKITPCLSTLTYKDRLQVLGLQSSESRRLQFDLIYAYKILTGRIDINITSVFTLQSYQSTRGHGYKNLPSWLSDRRSKILFRPTCYSSME